MDRKQWARIQIAQDLLDLSIKTPLPSYVAYIEKEVCDVVERVYDDYTATLQRYRDTLYAMSCGHGDLGVARIVVQYWVHPCYVDMIMNWRLDYNFTRNCYSHMLYSILNGPLRTYQVIAPADKFAFSVRDITLAMDAANHTCSIEAYWGGFDIFDEYVAELFWKYLKTRDNFDRDIYAGQVFHAKRFQWEEINKDSPQNTDSARAWQMYE